MMDTPNYILDEQLPETQDFSLLKKKGLSYIQAYTGNEWTNFNNTDPGITILDQLCYALTELGYCNDFPVPDLLTNLEGKIKIHNQFYLPEEILTTSPVTLNDYRKYIVDGVEGVKNVIVLPLENTTSGVYQVYLMTDHLITKSEEIQNIQRATFFYLNKQRNLGEIFLWPSQLQKRFYYLSGAIEIEEGVDLYKILMQIQQKIRNYIFPEVVQASHKKMMEAVLATNEIYDGPLLKNGWISSDALGEKKDTLNATELVHLIAAIPGVHAICTLGFKDRLAASTQAEENPAYEEVVSKPEQLLSINLIESVVCNELRVYRKDKRLTLNSTATSAWNTFPGGQLEAYAEVLPTNSFNTYDSLPIGNFRDINTYYSIQNTFPEIFAVGPDAIASNASDLQIAQSRQLKGYLVLFDQVLANQFSQLANIEKLFSFENSSYGAPSDKSAFYAVKNQYERKHLEYPVPYQIFSPTYFYQALYSVPHIKPLLKNNETFNFSIDVDEKELEQKSWRTYQQDPYNAYMHGLMSFMEDESGSLVRRNNILDHLLARHGESPFVINALISDSQYSGDTAKDRIIFKSLYLQNLRLLTYYKQKGYNFKGASKITDKITEVSPELKQQLLVGDSIDFILNSKKIDRAEKLTEQDFINYSAVELKLSLLFGLKKHYEKYIAGNSSQEIHDENSSLALWMLQERRGIMLIESALILQHADFTVVVTTEPGVGPYWQITKSMQQELAENLNYLQAMAIVFSFTHHAPNELAEKIQEGIITFGNFKSPVEEIQLCKIEKNLYQPIAGTGYSFSVAISSTSDQGEVRCLPISDNRVDLIFPGFIPPFNTPEFEERLHLFLQSSLPVHLPYKLHFASSYQLKKFIPAFVAWHTYLLKDDGQGAGKAADLAFLLNEISTSENE